MTKVEMIDSGKTWLLRVTGHAMYARDGEPDIVCSAISMLCCALGRALEGLTIGVKVRQEKGEFVLSCDMGKGKVVGAIHVAWTGFQMLAEKYPENVQIVERSV